MKNYVTSELTRPAVYTVRRNSCFESGNLHVLAVSPSMIHEFRIRMRCSSTHFIFFHFENKGLLM